MTSNQSANVHQHEADIDLQNTGCLTVLKSSRLGLRWSEGARVRPKSCSLKRPQSFILQVYYKIYARVGVGAVGIYLLFCFTLIFLAAPL